MNLAEKITLKELAKTAKLINLKIKKNASNKINDERKELERGYASARSAICEYEFE